MDNYNQGGISVSYNASTPSGLDFADISISIINVDVDVDAKFPR